MSRASNGTIRVRVTPFARQGNEVICAIEPGDDSSKTYVRGGLVLLDPPGDYDVVFELADGNYPDLQFDDRSPFWCSPQSCPRVSSTDPHFNNPHVPSGSNGRQAKVNTNSTRGRSPFHYSLNFTDGSRCDPIVINT